MSIDNFAANMAGGGARANQFRVIMNAPGFAGNLAGTTQQTSFLVRTASLPGQTITEIPINFRGRQLFLAGDRTFDPWTITIINDTGFEVRNAMERWMNGINSHNENTGLSNPTDYQSDAIVEQLNKAGEVTKRYDFRGIFPTNMSEIEVSYDSENQIEEFTMEFQVQYWESSTTS